VIARKRERQEMNKTPHEATEEELREYLRKTGGIEVIPMQHITHVL
jgi:hypothetical protein